MKTNLELAQDRIDRVKKYLNEWLNIEADALGDGKITNFEQAEQVVKYWEMELLWAHENYNREFKRIMLGDIAYGGW